MIRIAFFVALVLVSPIATYGAGSDINGKTLFEWCGASPMNSACILYISGFVQGVAAAGNGTFCLPKNFTGQEGIAVFLRIMRDIKMSAPVASAQVDLALSTTFGKAFPCNHPN